MPQFPFAFEFESERPNGNGDKTIVESPFRPTFPNLTNGNLATVLSPNYHSGSDSNANWTWGMSKTWAATGCSHSKQSPVPANTYKGHLNNVTTDLPRDIAIRVAPTMLLEARNSMVENSDLLTDEYDELVCLLRLDCTDSDSDPLPVSITFPHRSTKTEYLPRITYLDNESFWW